MPSPARRLASCLARLWRTDAPLTGTALLMLAALVWLLPALVVDDRLVTGAPVWLKPAKFAASIAVYGLTLAWTFTHLPEWPRLRRTVSLTSAAVFVGEMAVITLQAWRGVPSHFNVATPFDATLFALMGLGILTQTLAGAAVAVALWRQRFTDPALGWALRLGMALTIAGAAVGGLMAQPTAAQVAAARESGRLDVAGAHTVGAPDGGPGLPGTGWSVTQGDLRVPHFVGLHALQALPLLWLAVAGWRRAERTRVRLVLTGATSYAGLFLLLLWQALRGQSAAAPDAVAVGLAAAWLASTILAVAIAARDDQRAEPATARQVVNA